MVRELLIYGNFNETLASSFIQDVGSVDSESDSLVVRMNTNGGDPMMGFGMAAKFKEFKGKKIVKVDGKAYSTGLFFLAYADEVEALEESQFLLHRAAYPEFIEKSDAFKDGIKANLIDVNTSLRNAIESKIDVEAFEKITGKTLDEVFSMDSREDVYFSAKQAKKIGLISKVVKLTAENHAEITANMTVEMAAELKLDVKSINKVKMTKGEIQSQHPEAYESILGLGVAKGVAQEADRLKAWNAFAHVDAEAVKKGIESGENMSQSMMAELSLKSAKLEAAKVVEKENADEGKTEPTPIVPELDATAKWELQANAVLGLNTEKK